MPHLIAVRSLNDWLPLRMCLTFLAVATTLFASAAEPGFEGLDLTRDWPWWRGPTHDGIAAAGQTPPLIWSDTENILWTAPVPGRGHGSPTVVGEHVYLAFADAERETQGLQCFDRKTGQRLWSTDLHSGGFDRKENKKSSLASCSVCCDGQRLYIGFLHAGAVHATCLTRGGETVWRKKVSDFVNHQGFGASPLRYKSLVIIAADNKGGGAMKAFDAKTGLSVWKVERPKLPNYTSPIVLNIGGRDQLILIGCDAVTSFDPLTGKTLWETAGATTECVTTTITDGERIFTSGGYPKNHISAVFADGSGKLAWEKPLRVYVPSMLVRNGHLYGVLDAGVATCLKSDTGAEVWKERIAGTFSSSLVMVNDTLMATSETGKTYLFRATPEGFQSLGENSLGDEAFGTPAVCGSRIYHRIARQVEGKRQEFVVCIGK